MNSKYALVSLIVVITGFSSAPSLAFGDPDNPLQELMMLGGECPQPMTRYGVVETASKCKSIMNSLYKNGRTGFYFYNDDFMITFSGVQPQVKTSQDSAVQPIDLVLTNDLKKGNPSQPIKLNSAGACSFANPFRGLPVTIKYSAERSKVQFADTFQSDGSKPVILIEKRKILD